MNKQKKHVEPYKPIPFRKGNNVKKIYKEHFDDGAGHTAMITYCDFYDKKNVLHEKYTLYIKWD